MSRYYGEVINLSLRDISMLKKFKIVDIKKRFLGLVKIYTVELPSKKIEEIAKDFQSNMSTSLKKEWYITFHNRERVIVIFRTRIFDLSGKGITPIHGKMLDISHAEDKENWNELIFCLWQFIVKGENKISVYACPIRFSMSYSLFIKPGYILKQPDQF